MTSTSSSVFRTGGGAMGAKIRGFDWAATPLGALSGWPAALRISVDLMMASDFPACLFWGPDLVALYNDGYRPMLGNKPEALGQPLRVTWAEAWGELQPIADKALRGESTYIEDFLVRINRHGELEDAYFTFCYSPVYDEHGAVAGMLDTVVETTAKVLAERQAREEAERQQALLQQMPGFVGVLSGPSHVYTYVNDAYLRIAGRRDFLGRTVKQVFPELEGQGFFEMLDRVYTTGEAIRASAIPIRLADEAAPRYIDLLYEAIRDRTGQITGIFVGGYDVSEQVRANDSLRASETRLRELNTDLERRVVERTLARGRIWHLSPELLSVLDIEGRFEVSNPAWQALLGWSDAEMALMPYEALVHPDDRAASHAAWERAVVHGLPVIRFENRYLVKGGGWRWLSWIAVPEDGKVYCSARDIQEEKDHALVLAQRTRERDVLARIVETTNAFVQVLDMDFRFLAINKANVDEFERIYGHRPQVGDNLLDLLADRPDHRDAAEALWRRVLAGESFTVVDEFGDPALSRRAYDLTFEVLRAPDGTQVGAFLTCYDITEKLRAQAALVDAQEALRQSQKMEAVGQLTGGLAHDFNNLLAGIAGSLEMMAKRVAEGRLGELDRYIGVAQGATRRAAALTHRLLAFSRRQTLEPKAVNVSRLVTGMEDLVRRTIGPGVALTVQAPQPPDELWGVRVDPGQLENALLNLCINARDAMPEGGQLTIALGNCPLASNSDTPPDLPHDAPPGDCVCLSVRDTGVGMSAEVIARAFDPFFTTKPIGLGTGLGLSMVYGFARQSGGRAHIVSRPGEGTEVCLLLPRHDGANIDEAQASQPATAPRAGDGETVLVVDDEPTVRMLLVELMEELGYTTLEAADGASALVHLHGPGRIDLLITDVGLPGGMNGRQVADAARVGRPGLKVLFITGYAETAVMRGGHLDHGMQVMTKPFELDALADRVRALMDGPAGM